MAVVVGNTFYFWIGAVVLLALWIPMSHHAFAKRGRFIIMPASGMAGTSYGSSRRSLLIFTGMRAVAIVACIVLALLQLHT